MPKNVYTHKIGMMSKVTNILFNIRLQYERNIRTARMVIFMFLFVQGSILTSCKKLLEVDGPIDKVDESAVFDSDTKAIAAMTSVYFNLSENTKYWSLAGGLSADEFLLLDGEGDYGRLYRNDLIATDAFAFWKISYDNIFSINTFLENAGIANFKNESVKNQLIGEAKFMRAFFNFYLVNFYGPIPLLTTSNYKINASLKRTDVSTIYEQITVDLKEAKERLSDKYLGSDLLTVSEERVRPNKYAAAALLARVYLYQHDWLNAEQEASFIISNTSTYSLTDLESVFLKNSSESIWQTQPVIPMQQTNEARMFILSSGPNYDKPVAISNDLYSSFDDNDKRKDIWIGTDNSTGKEYKYVFKYKNEDGNAVVTEYSMMLRLAEQYLIRAEARAELGRIVGSESAQADINIIRNRAGLHSVDNMTKDEILLSIEHERRVELFAEWSHRWFDLKRSALVNIVMPVASALKGGEWKSTDVLYPIPASDIQRNPNLKPQNPGY